MNDWAILTTIGMAAVAWGASVERRLTGRQVVLNAVADLKGDVAKLDKRQEDLIDFLLRDARARIDEGRGLPRPTLSGH